MFDYWTRNDREAVIALHRDPACKTCQRQVETKDCVLQCELKERRKIWFEMIEKLQEFFGKSKTPKEVKVRDNLKHRKN